MYYTLAKIELTESEKHTHTPAHAQKKNTKQQKH